MFNLNLETGKFGRFEYGFEYWVVDLVDLADLVDLVDQRWWDMSREVSKFQIAVRFWRQPVESWFASCDSASTAEWPTQQLMLHKWRPHSPAPNHFEHRKAHVDFFLDQTLLDFFGRSCCWCNFTPPTQTWHFLMGMILNWLQQQQIDS